MKLLIMVLAILLSGSVFAQQNLYPNSNPNSFVDTRGVPYYTHPGTYPIRFHPPCGAACVSPCGMGCAPVVWVPPPCVNCGWGRNSSSWGGGLTYMNGQIGGSFFINQHQHFNGCGHSGWGHNSSSWGGSVNSWGGQTGGSIFFNRSQSNW